MKTALLEIKEKFSPDRIFVETSGSAFPATLAFQIRELERETSGAFRLDAIVTVVDAENFMGYEDTSPTARMQASYTDLILINKWENVSERQLEAVMDHLHTLNDLTPKVKCSGRNGVDPNLVFGIDSKLFSDASQVFETVSEHNDEVETVTLWRGSDHFRHNHSHLDTCSDTTQNTADENTDSIYLPQLTEELLVSSFQLLSKESVWRVKGFIAMASPAGICILNWAFGRYELLPGDSAVGSKLDGAEVLLTVMGEKGEVRRAVKAFVGAMGLKL